ncbi:MAG: hypothetical protein ABL878_14380 [Burkholderiales bacterium]
MTFHKPGFEDQEVRVPGGERVSKDPVASPQTGSFYEAGGEVYNFGIQITIRT